MSDWDSVEATPAVSRWDATPGASGLGADATPGGRWDATPGATPGGATPGGATPGATPGGSRWDATPTGVTPRKNRWDETPTPGRVRLGSEDQRSALPAASVTLHMSQSAQ